MSLLHLDWALNDAPVRTSAQRCALIVFANSVLDDRGGVMPAMLAISRVACVDREGALQLVDELVAEGLVTLHGPRFEMEIKGARSGR